jgi:hypothetical protein
MTKLKLTGWGFTGKIGQLINGNRVSVERFKKKTNVGWFLADISGFSKTELDTRSISNKLKDTIYIGLDPKK